MSEIDKAHNKIVQINRAFASSEEMAWDAGYRCGRNGPDENNSHFRWFRTPELTAQWEDGKRTGEQQS